MTTHHLKSGHRRKAILWIGLLFASSIAVLWGWNTFAVELLAQEPMRFKHALALQFLVLSVASALPLIRALFRPGQA